MHKRMSPQGNFDHMIDITYVLTTQYQYVKNNRYGHTNKEVFENLKESKIYGTDEDGSIMFNNKNNKLKIETCSL